MEKSQRKVDSFKLDPYIEKYVRSKTMAMSSDQIRGFIIQAFPDAHVDLRDLRGDNDHFSATITSMAFSGRTRIQQHQMVYEALQGHIGTTLHALSLKTQIPME